jgi:transcriptional regulator with XRE-family HTH domain
MALTPDHFSERARRGLALRQRREALGISRLTLAGLVDCSMSQLSLIEQGAVPERSDVFRRAVAALDRIEAEQAAAA